MTQRRLMQLAFHVLNGDRHARLAEILEWYGRAVYDKISYMTKGVTL